MKRKSIDLLVEQFWKQGYLTLSRKFGTYLPEPTKIGNFDIDIVAKQKKNYAIGITLSPEDFAGTGLIDKINFLATRHTRFSNKKVTLFVGVPAEFIRNAKAVLELLNPEIRKNIKLIEIIDRDSMNNQDTSRSKVLFS
ncbi:MAG: hypothetical protein IPM56_01860 [Ignavibacteriales bacterium]|nr:MAG: hypothetical protein IPM56_01860 [Ignavibacteriales bacterium]